MLACPCGGEYQCVCNGWESKNSGVLSERNACSCSTNWACLGSSVVLLYTDLRPAYRTAPQEPPTNTTSSAMSVMLAWVMDVTFFWCGYVISNANADNGCVPLQTGRVMSFITEFYRPHAA